MGDTIARILLVASVVGLYGMLGYIELHGTVPVKAMVVCVVVGLGACWKLILDARRSMVDDEIREMRKKANKEVKKWG